MSDTISVVVTEEIITATVGQVTDGYVVSVPAGGTTGEVLKKLSNSDYDIGWEADSGSSGVLTIRKGANESRVSNTTLTADSALQIAMTAGQSYTINGRIYLSSANSNMGYKFDMNYTGSLSLVHRRVNYTVAGATTGGGTFSYGSALQPSTPVTGVTSGLAYIEFSLVCTASTSGTFQFRWAQNTADASNLTVLRGSYLEYAIS